MTYPKHVIGEYETVAKIATGLSIARYGDGELKILDGFGYTRTHYVAVPALTEELRRVIRVPHPRCLIGIPTMDPNGLKYESFVRHSTRFAKFVREGDGNTYYSSLITRPDCGTWLETRKYYDALVKIWEHKRRVCVVAEPESKLLTHVRLSHADVTHVPCPMYNAYAEIDRMQTAVIATRPDIALLSIGVVATALAYRLTHAGIHAVDLGSVGGFLIRWRTGAPKPARREDYAKEREGGPENN